MTILISNLQEADIDGAVTCIQKAFEHDPYNNWVFDSTTFSHQRNRVSLSIRCRWGMQHAMFHVAKDDAAPDKVLGVACWLPPRDPSLPQTWSDYLGSWKLWLQQVQMNTFYGRGGLNVKRYYIWKAAQAAAQEKLWTDRRGYYFNNIVTVLPEEQGKGIGKLLFKHVSDQADREGMNCYLESSRAVPNTAIYEKLGFHVAQEMLCDDDGTAITLYCMMRPPQSIAGTRTELPG